jgi:TP901 family phage tail tape measure protein
MANEALYKIKVEVDSSGVGGLKKDVDDVKAKGNGVPFTFDVKFAKEELAQLAGAVKNSFGGLGESIKQGIGIGAGVDLVNTVKGALGGVMKATEDFDQNIRNVGSLGVQNFEAIGDELLSLSKRVPETAAGLANATYQAISAGIDPTKVVSFVEQASKTAVAGQATTEQAVNALTSVLNAYKLKTEDAANVSDALFGAIKFGKTTFNELNSALSNVVPVAASVNVGIDQVTAAIASMTNQGVPTAQASTQIRQALVEIQKPGADLAKVMKAAGTSVEDLKNPAIGLNGTLQKIAIEAEKEGKSMTQVFSSVEAGSAALLLSGENAAAAAKTLENVRGSAGSTSDAFGVLSGSIKNQIAIGKNWVEGSLIPLTKHIGGVIGVVGPAVTGITQLAGITPIAAAGTKIFAAGQAVLNAVMSLNPIGLVVIALVAVGAALYLAYQKSETFRNAVGAVWAVLKATGEFIGAFVKTEIAALAQGFKGAATVIDGLIHMDLGKVKQGAAEVGKAIDTGMGGAKAGVTAFNASIKESVADMKKSGDEGKAAGEKTALSFGTVKQTVADLKKELAGLGAAFDEETKAAKENAEKEISQITALKKERSTAHGDRLVEINAELKEQERSAKQNADTFKQNSAARKKEEDRFFGVKQSVDLLALAKQHADAEAKQLEVRLRLQRAAEGMKFSTIDELTVERQRSDELDKQFNKLHILTNKKYKLAGQLELDQEQIKNLELTAKVRVDQLALERDLQASVDNVFNKQVEIGIVSQPQALAKLKQDLRDAQAELGSLQSDPSASSKELQDAKGRQLDLIKQIIEGSKNLYKQGTDDRIAAMLDGFEKEKEAIDENFQIEELQFSVFAENNIDLTQEQLNRKAAIERKHLADLAALRKKYAKDDASIEIDIQKAATQFLQGYWSSFFQKKEQMSQTDIDLQRDQYAHSERDLVRQLIRGEISQKDYAHQLAKINKDRAELEKKIEGDKYAFIKKQSNDLYDSLTNDIDRYVKAEIAAGIQSLLFSNDVNQQKTSNAAAGANANASIKNQESGDNLKGANSAILGAVAETIAKYTSSLPPIVGTALGIAAGFALLSAFNGLKSLVGFEKGGIVTGEKGPEIISPAREFSEFAAQLVVSTTKAVRDGLRDAQGGGRSGRRLEVGVTGRLVTRGRDNAYQLKRDKISRRTEQMIPTTD